jgi:hypothetical protein
MTTTTITLPDDHSAYRLADGAGCYSPDSPDSPGARFLRSVQDATREAVLWAAEYDTDGDLLHAVDNVKDDTAHQVADDAVPIYTHELWSTFADLGAYEEDPSEYGPVTDMGRAAGVCLYMIAERLVHALLSEYEAHAQDQNGEEN